MMQIAIDVDVEVDAEYPKNLLNLHGDLPFLAKRNKI